MEIIKHKKTLLYVVFSIASVLLLTFFSYFFLDKYSKENIFIEIFETHSDQKIIFLKNENQEQNIDFYKTLNDVEKILLSTNLFSEVYKLNHREENYKIRNRLFYNILNTCKMVYYCSDKTSAPMLYDDIPQEDINATNFDCILINKNEIKKLYARTKINLDQFIDAGCLSQIVEKNKDLHDFYLQKDEEIFVSGDQNKYIKGWNLLKKIKIQQQTENTVEENTEIENERLKDIDIQVINKNIEDIVMKINSSKINHKNENFDFVTFVQNSNDILDLSQAIALKFKVLKKKQEVTQKIEEKNDDFIILRFKNIKNKAISMIKGVDFNNSLKKQYGIKKNTNYEIKRYFIDASLGTVTKPNFIIAFVFAEENILAKTLLNALVINNFEDADKIINKIRYHDCQYFVLYENEDGFLNYENSAELKVKQQGKDYNISFYE